MKITVEQLEKARACTEGIEWFKKQNCTDLKEVIQKAIETKDFNILKYANWGLTRFLSKKDKIRYAIFAAEQVLYLYEKKYPKDKRPREAIQAAKNYLEKPTLENKKAAAAYAAAAFAAGAAAYATAADAADAAAFAAGAAAFTADAADAAADAAFAATDAAFAATDAAGIKLLSKILEYGITLIK